MVIEITEINGFWQEYSGFAEILQFYRFIDALCLSGSGPHLLWLAATKQFSIETVLATNDTRLMPGLDHRPRIIITRFSESLA